jgi:diguanylate cyclase (GGDEF)-like protein
VNCQYQTLGFGKLIRIDRLVNQVMRHVAERTENGGKMIIDFPHVTIRVETDGHCMLRQGSENRKMMQTEIDGAIQEKRDYIVENRVTWPDNSVHWRTSSGQAFYDDTGHVTRMSGITLDIDDRKLAEERVQFLACYDALTGLPNRTLLRVRLARAFAGARRQKYKVALLFLDLDRFKDINDSLGHSVGDLLLQEVAGRLKAWGREQDTVARVCGDEFLIVLTGLKDVMDVAVAAERLMDAMTAEFVVQGRSLSIGCSVGISIFPEHGTEADDLIKNADAAMYCAKGAGRNNFRFYTENMNAQAVERLTLENSLRLALDKKNSFSFISHRWIWAREGSPDWKHFSDGNTRNWA